MATVKKDPAVIKSDRLKKTIDTFVKKMEAEGVNVFVGATDREAPDGGKVYIESSENLNGEDLGFILECAFSTRQDRVNLGIIVGRLLTGNNPNKGPKLAHRARRSASTKPPKKR